MKYESLIKHMAQNNLAPESILADNNRHIYPITRNGKKRKATYIAIPFPLEQDGPALICAYSIIDEKKTHMYSSDSKKKI